MIHPLRVNKRSRTRSLAAKNSGVPASLGSGLKSKGKEGSRAPTSVRRNEMASKFEVIEMEKNKWNHDGWPSITNRWVCDSAEDALNHSHVREVEAEILGRTDAEFAAREDGEPINLAGWEVPDDDFMFGVLAEMGYRIRNSFSAFSECKEVKKQKWPDAFPATGAGSVPTDSVIL